MINKKHTKKGFTLVELVIVIAIIGVLTMMVMVAWNRVLNRSKVNDANTKAKIIYNAAQTVAIKYSTTERNLKADDRYMGNGDFYLYWNGSRASSGPSANNTPNHNNDDERFGAAINRILDENGTYKVFIRNYVVQSVVYQDNDNSRFFGAYPVSIIEPSSGKVSTCNDMAQYSVSP